jgi:hypothetical protein
MRGIVVGQDYSGDVDWIRDAVAAVLPGLRVVVEGRPPELPGVEVLAETTGLWVGRRSADR